MLEGKSSGEYMRGFTSSIRREPIGPVGQVAPWNYPMMMSVWKFAPALAAGNTVVLKPSDTTPASSYWMVERMQEIFPPGVCNLVCGDRDTGVALTAHPIPQLVSITGSTRAGIAVATAAAQDVKRAHLELGGKAPVVVFDDVDIAAAVDGISVAGLFNGGQDCTAATRLIVSPGVHADFVAALTGPVTSFQHSALVTEHGCASVFGRSQRAQARLIIDEMAHPDVRRQLHEAAKGLGLGRPPVADHVGNDPAA